MFSHVMVGANDIEASRKFYDAILGALDIPPGKADEKGRFFYMTETGVLAISRPIDGQPACGANGGTVGFRAASPAQADAWHAAGVASGGSACEDPPGTRDMGSLGKMYLAYLRDPAGNKLCVLYPIPA